MIQIFHANLEGLEEMINHEKFYFVKKEKLYLEINNSEIIQIIGSLKGESVLML
jgi:hypothetical protein